ncbi:unnamed protein product [Rotaria sp. Silwood1]|nr:unnamed protein product [Rotaria sp. Silwood1]CAF1182427.1 unnamed protein product [Rotaria sp. Silwood1]CAF3480783.1 unnamed protein product [Rotaria sp. Silwood1]CAF4922200.1 unnamed protein product [Rotaria sp. Silwood1]
MSSLDNYYSEILNNIIVYLYRYGNLTIYIIGNIGNLLSIFIFCKKSWRKNVCVFYFLIFLLLSSAYLNSTILGTAFINGFQIYAQNSSVILCKLLHYTAVLFSTLLPTILILSSIDRLLISLQNVDTRLYSSKRLAYFSISLSTFFWIIFNLHILIKVNIQQISSNVLDCYFDYSTLYFQFVTYSLMIFNCFFCLFMIILSIFAYKNVRHIRCIPRNRQYQIRTMTKKDFQLLRCLFIQDIVYIFVSLIPALYSVYITSTKDQIRTPLEESIVYFLQSLFTFIYFTFYGSSFFIFFIVSKAFQHGLKRFIFKIIGKELMTLREEDNRQENNENLNIPVVSTIILSR